MKLKADDYKPMEPGDYRAQFTGYEEVEEGAHGPFVKYFFTVLDEEHAGRSLKGVTSTAFNPKSKSWAWIHALLGRPIERGEEIELDDLVGRKVVLDIDHQQTDRGTFERIAGVRPIRKRKEEADVQADEQDFNDLPF